MDAKRIKVARKKGEEDYNNGVPLSANFYQHIPNSQGGIMLMAQWDAGWKLAELKDRNPDKFKELNKGEQA